MVSGVSCSGSITGDYKEKPFVNKEEKIRIERIEKSKICVKKNWLN